MLFKRASKKALARIDSLIGSGTIVQGDILFSGGLRIDGEVKGNVRSKEGEAGTLVLSEKARVEGEIRVSHVVVNGSVVGPVISSEFLELQPGARVTGDVSYNNLEMHLGAVVEGQLMHQSGESRTVELKLASNN